MFDFYLKNNHVVIVTRSENLEDLGKNIKISIPVADVEQKIKEHENALANMEKRKTQKEFLETAVNILKQQEAEKQAAIEASTS